MLWVFVVRALAWCSHILEISSIHTGEQIKNNIFFKNPSERSRKGKIALHFTERPLATVVTLCFRWPLREVFIPYVWFLVSASLKVRPCTEQDKYVSQDSCCFFRALVYLALSARFLRFSREFRMWSIQYFTSLSSERQHFLFTISSSGSA